MGTLITPRSGRRRFRRVTMREMLLAQAFMTPAKTRLRDAVTRLRTAHARRRRDIAAGSAGTSFEEQHLGPKQEDAARRQAARPECEAATDDRRRAAV